MNTRKYVHSLFASYEQNEELCDFMEELQSNLEDRIAYLKQKGWTEDKAFDKAAAELGDVSEIAEQMSLSKKKEVFESMYMKTRNYITNKRMAAYVAGGGILLFGAVFALLSYLYSSQPMAPVGIMIPFGILPVCFLIFLGLTQETARKIPMAGKRPLFYAIAIGVFLLGILLSLSMFIIKDTGLPEAVAVLIPFVLPSILVLAFLLLTEKDRSKPWFLEEQKKWTKPNEEYLVNPKDAMRFGMLSGVLWVFAVALFLTLGFIIGFKYAWLVFLFTAAGELLLVYFFAPNK